MPDPSDATPWARLWRPSRVGAGVGRQRQISSVRSQKHVPRLGPGRPENSTAALAITLPVWGDLPRGLAVPDALLDPGHDLRPVAPHHFSKARLKLVEEVKPRVAANRRTKIVERHRSGSRPIGTVSRVDHDRSQQPEEKRSVQAPLAGLVTRDEIARSGVSDPAHEGVAGRRGITQVLLAQRLVKKRGGTLFESRPRYGQR